MPRVTYEITENDSNQRLDKFAKKLLKDTPLAGIYKMIRSKDIVLNGAKSTPESMIQIGDSVRIFHRELPEGDPQETVNVSPKMNSTFRDMIIYEDQDFVCVNKVAHLNVHPGDHKSDEVSLIELALDYYGGSYNSLTFKPSLVHRIDRQTTGCVLIAKNKPTLDSLLTLLQSGSIEKVYLALCIDKPAQEAIKARDTISLPLKRYDTGGGAKVMVDPTGEPSITHYRTLKELGGKYRLVECILETGRMHQIRVHLGARGLPILGDGYYGEKGENSYAKRVHKIDHQLLHASKLRFPHPRSGSLVEISAPLPREFEEIIKYPFV